MNLDIFHGKRHFEARCLVALSSIWVSAGEFTGWLHCTTLCVQGMGARSWDLFVCVVRRGTVQLIC
ncbi:hypothetical protein WG66_009251, partial [Moniliophthora roreri]